MVSLSEGFRAEAGVSVLGSGSSDTVGQRAMTDLRKVTEEGMEACRMR